MAGKQQKLVLFIEGTDDTSNGVLKEGFRKLLAQQLKGKMPQIIMGGGKDQAIRKFMNSRTTADGHLLIDLDGPENVKATHLQEKSLQNEMDQVFFMIQEMEAWFLSQPRILDDFYQMKVSDKIPARPAAEIGNPSDFLQSITKHTKKGKYHKVQHGTALLQRLDAGKVMAEFPDFKSLIEKLAG